MMGTPNDFWDVLRSLRNELLNMIPIVRMATVVSVAPTTNNPTIRFDGDTVASQKLYKRVRNYASPQVNDRVMLLNGIIIGGWQP